jgi:hypothetical protein
MNWLEKKQLKKEQRSARRAERRARENGYFTLEDVIELLKSHPADCVFELNAPQKILERLSGRTITEWITGCTAFEFRQCFIQSEIYCPHEGVDRRAEYGI